MPSKTTKTTKPTEPKKPAAKAATAKTTKTAEARKAPARAAKPTPPPRTAKAPKAGAVGIGDTVRAVVDAAAAIVGAAVSVHGAVTAGKKKGKTAKAIDRALEVAGGVTAAAVALIDLNRAAPDALASLKHIGPKRAQKIVEARPFQAVDELAARKLLPKKAVDELRGKLSV
ncbi:ComEA family DNA-binding protein [Azospirillum sp. sgz301742]